MSDNDAFAENPFRALNLKSFPDKKKERRSGIRAATGEKARKTVWFHRNA